MQTPKLIAITPGEPSGIGPDICLMLAHQTLPAIPVAFADPNLMQQRNQMLGLDTKIELFNHGKPPQKQQAGILHIIEVDLAEEVYCGQLNTANADYVLSSIKKAVTACQENTFHALVTGPVNKACIIESGQPFTGHTEFLAELTCAKPVMMLATPSLRVALATTHIPLAEVPAAITYETLVDTIKILHKDLIRVFAISQPRIAITGLNPHAGEQGHLGREEIDIIEPVIASLLRQGIQLYGPLPADTAFTPDSLSQCDAVLAMYHDQGLPVLKHAGFGKAINITLGLPIIRTSVDHGTALDLAGTGRASPDSLHAAFNFAANLHR